MLQTDKIALHYTVLANKAHTLEKVARELADLYKAPRTDNTRIDLREKHLQQYLKELVAEIQ